MRVLLIRPRTISDAKKGKKLSRKIIIYPDLTLSQLAGNTPEKHDIEIIFEYYEKINFNWDGDLVGITCVTPQAPEAYRIADKFRSKGLKVVLGGWHPSALPDEAKQHADSVVIGEAEETWSQLLSDLEKNALRQFYRNEKSVDLNLIKNAKRSACKDFSFVAGIQATRGCPMGCEFCGVSNSPDGRIFRMRPIEKVIEEIKKIRQRQLYFYDPSLTINPKYTKELFAAMKNLNKKFTCFGNIDILGNDDELLKLASNAGCQNWFVGFESVSQAAINNLGKRSNKVERYFSAVEKIHKYGMSVIGAFIFGFDTDTKSIFDDTIDAIYKLNIDIAEFTILTPYPGTPLFNRLDREGRILTKDWSKYTERGNVVFQPKNMIPEELLAGTQQVNKEINSISEISRRLVISKRFTLNNITGNIFQRF